MKENNTNEKLTLAQHDIFKNINKDTDIHNIVSNLDNGIKDLLKSNGFKNYLNYMSSFYSYSYNNIFLILMQKNDASHVGSYTFWKSKKRFVKKGEHGIRILAPTTAKKEIEVELYNEKNEHLTNPDGSIKTQTETRNVITGFKWVSVFDISQTDGEPMPNILKNLEKNTPVSKLIIDIISEESKIPVKFEDIQKNGYYNKIDNEIVIKENMSNDQTVKTLIHEYTHSLIHKDITDYQEQRSFYEMQAEGVAYVVLNRYGLDTSEYSFGYVSSWVDDLADNKYKEALSIIQREAGNIISKIDDKIEKELELLNINREKKLIHEVRKEGITPNKSLIKNILNLEDRINEKLNIHLLCEGKVRIPEEAESLKKIKFQVSQLIQEM